MRRYTYCPDAFETGNCAGVLVDPSRILAGIPFYFAGFRVMNVCKWVIHKIGVYGMKRMVRDSKAASAVRGQSCIGTDHDLFLFWVQSCVSTLN